MKNILNSKKIYRIILIVFLVYCITIIVKQQTKLNSYVTESKYYEDKINSLNEEKQQLLETQENVNSPEYIENVAREKLEMYLPNEQIFVDINN
jgi:cell division protein FtsL